MANRDLSISRPTEKKSAELFLRSEDAGVYSLIKLDEFIDKLRVVVKGVNLRGQNVTLQLSDELPLDDKEKYQAKFLAMAQEAHQFWQTLSQDSS